MKLLIVTQTVDDADPILGFFTRWIEKLSSGFESVEVMCLSEGTHTLPKNVRVHTLGKPAGARAKKRIIYDAFLTLVRRVRYSLGVIALVWRLRREYDAVLVHMNEEYVLIAGPLWKLLGKRVYLWRNHGSGSWPTHIAAFWSRRVFHTSSASYTARFQNARRMPVGVDLARFGAPDSIRRLEGSILMVGRVAPKKHVREVVEALIALSKDHISLSLSLVGPLDDARYRDKVVGLASAANIGLSVRGSVPHTELPSIYAQHDIVINVSAPGMFDKTMFEALAAGCVLLTRHEDLAGELDARLRTTGEVADIAAKLRVLCAISESEKHELREKGKLLARTHSLDALVAQLTRELYA